MRRFRFSNIGIIAGFSCLLCTLTPEGHSVYAGGQRETAYQTEEYQQRPTLEASLFKSDQSAMGEEAIQRVLASKFALPKSIDVAILKIPDTQQQAIRYYGYGYFRSEEYLKNQQTLVEAITGEVMKSDRVSGTTLLPSILTPKEPTLALIRETAVRLQSDMLLVFRLTSDIYEKYRAFQAYQAKAFCTCEGFLLDVRTGLIPFSRIVTREYLATEAKPDANFRETMSRAEREAALLSLKAIGQEMVEFLKKVPPPAAALQQTTPEPIPESTTAPDVNPIGIIDAPFRGTREAAS